MRTEQKKARAAARKRREAWMAEVNERWAAFVAERVGRANLMAREPDPIKDLPVARGMAITS